MLMISKSTLTTITTESKIIHTLTHLIVDEWFERFDHGQGQDRGKDGTQDPESCQYNDKHTSGPLREELTEIRESHRQ